MWKSNADTRQMLFVRLNATSPASSACKLVSWNPILCWCTCCASLETGSNSRDCSQRDFASCTAFRQTSPQQLLPALPANAQAVPCLIRAHHHCNAESPMYLWFAEHLKVLPAWAPDEASGHCLLHVLCPALLTMPAQRPQSPAKHRVSSNRPHLPFAWRLGKPLEIPGGCLRAPLIAEGRHQEGL